MATQEVEEIPTRITNIELAKIVREQNVANKALNRRLQELEKKLEDKHKEEFEKEEGSEEEEDDTSQNIPKDQRPFIDALKSMARRKMEEKMDFPVFNGKMNVDLALDWIEALTNFFLM